MWIAGEMSFKSVWFKWRTVVMEVTIHCRRPNSINVLRRHVKSSTRATPSLVTLDPRHLGLSCAHVCSTFHDHNLQKKTWHNRYRTYVGEFVGRMTARHQPTAPVNRVPVTYAVVRIEEEVQNLVQTLGMIATAIFVHILRGGRLPLLHYGLSLRSWNRVHCEPLSPALHQTLSSTFASNCRRDKC